MGFVDSIVRFLCSFLWNFGCPFLLSIVLSVPPSVVLFFCPLCCLFLLRLSFSFVHYVVCSSSIYDSDYQFAIFNIFLSRCPFPLRHCNACPSYYPFSIFNLFYYSNIYICFSQWSCTNGARSQNKWNMLEHYYNDTKWPYFFKIIRLCFYVIRSAFDLSLIHLCKCCPARDKAWSENFNSILIKWK